MRPITDELRDMFPDVMVVRAVLTRSASGTPLTYGPDVEVPVKLSSCDMTLFRDRGGKERASTSMATTCGHFGITTEHEVVSLPARFKPPRPEIVGVSQPSDENGAHHQRVNFG